MIRRKIIPFSNILRVVAMRTKTDYKTVHDVVLTTMSVFREALYSNLTIQIPKLGSFIPTRIKGRLQNMPTGHQVWSPARTRIKFKVSGYFKKHLDLLHLRYGGDEDAQKIEMDD